VHSRLQGLKNVNPEAQEILQNLREVSAERMARNADPGLDARVAAIKAYQHARFMHTYADLLAGGRYAGAAQFFLDDLYGPGDFTRRDEQFARVVPGMSRVFPHEVCRTVLLLSELHALSERMDTAMGRMHPAGPVSGASYGVAWRAVGHPESRERQIVLMLAVGRALDGYTRSALLRHSLRLLRGPAHAAGLGSLQEFLERGFDTFRAMKGAEGFLSLVAERERDLAGQLFGGAAAPLLRP
jgi:hypothetical protein